MAEHDATSAARVPASGASRPPAALHGLSALRPRHGPLLVVVGVFDGLHRGHGYLLRELRAAAGRLGAVPAVLTFDHHPDEIVAGAAPPLLVDPDERLARLSRAGVAVTIVQHFDEALRRTPYDEFVASIRARTGLAGFLMTPDAAFGHQRLGTPTALSALGARDGFAVVVVPPFDLGGRHVRSTEIRSAIAGGDLVTARTLLGRRVAVTGEVVDRSDGGREAMLRFEVPVALPPAGTYAATVEPAIRPGSMPERPHAAVARVGEDGSLRVRARPDVLTGARLRVAFVRPG
jgi:riboflavin kinase/FMN adenylyltransferase